MNHKLQPKSFVMHLSLSHGDYDNVTVEFDYQPREDDVNVGESVDICACIWDDGEDLLDRMHEGEIRELEAEVLDRLNGWWEGYWEARAEAKIEARAEARRDR